MLTKDVIKYIEDSVLCWVATVSQDGIPNVSPKEVFTQFGEDSIIIANIASPNTVRNILYNRNVCISFIDILVQKGYQLHGIALILTDEDAQFKSCEARLLEMTKGKYPFNTITKIEVNKTKPIIAPSYLLYPDTNEEDQIQAARKTYGLNSAHIF